MWALIVAVSWCPLTCADEWSAGLYSSAKRRWLGDESGGPPRAAWTLPRSGRVASGSQVGFEQVVVDARFSPVPGFAAAAFIKAEGRRAGLAGRCHGATNSARRIGSRKNQERPQQLAAPGQSAMGSTEASAAMTKAEQPLIRLRRPRRYSYEHGGAVRHRPPRHGCHGPCDSFRLLSPAWNDDPTHASCMASRLVNSLPYRRTRSA